MTDQTKAAAALLAGKRKSYPGVCERCGEKFAGLKRKRYCSKNCGVAAWQKAARRARRAPQDQAP